MALLPPDEIAALRALLKCATQGPWRLMHGGNEWEIQGVDPLGEAEEYPLARVHIRNQTDSLPDENAKLIVAAHNAFPALLDAAEEALRLRDKRPLVANLATALRTREAERDRLAERVDELVLACQQKERVGDGLIVENARLAAALRVIVDNHDTWSIAQLRAYIRIEGEAALKGTP